MSVRRGGPGGCSAGGNRRSWLGPEEEDGGGQVAQRVCDSVGTVKDDVQKTIQKPEGLGPPHVVSDGAAIRP